MLGWILGGLGGLGVVGAIAACIFVPGAGEVLLGLGRAIGNFLAKVPPWVYAAVALVGLIAFLFISRGDWIKRARGDEAQLAQICEAVRTADNNPKLDCSKAGAQILLIGRAMSDTTAAIGRQNAAISNLAATSAQQQQQAELAEKTAVQRADQADAIAAQFEAESRALAAAGSSGAKNCEVSNSLQEQWP